MAVDSACRCLAVLACSLAVYLISCCSYSHASHHFRQVSTYSSRRKEIASQFEGSLPGLTVQQSEFLELAKNIISSYEKRRVDALWSSFALFALGIAGSIAASLYMVDKLSLLVSEFTIFFLIGTVVVAVILASACAPKETERELRARRELEHLHGVSQRWLRTQTSFWMELSGHQFEHEVGKVLNDSGYITTVTKASGDGGIDLIAIRKGEVIAIQCKAHRNPIGPGPVRELHGVMTSLAAQGKAAVGMVVSRSGFTEGAANYARSASIRLLDLTDILRMQSQATAKH